MTQTVELRGQMRQPLEAWLDLKEEAWERLVSLFRTRTLEARQPLFLPGATEFELLFVCRGLLRFYYLDADGNEANKAFIAENTFAAPLAALALKLPLLYGVEALEPTVLLAADMADIVALYDQDPVFERLGRKLAELLLTRKELRTRSLLQQSAKERYCDFKAQHPDLLLRVPQYHIASYLGITEVSLSRLKRETLERPYALLGDGVPRG